MEDEFKELAEMLQDGCCFFAGGRNVQGSAGPVISPNEDPNELEFVARIGDNLYIITLRKGE